MSFIGVGCANKKRCRVRSGLSLSVVLCPLLILQLTSPLVKVNRKSKFVLTCFVDSSGDVAKGYLECHDSVYVASSHCLNALEDAWPGCWKGQGEPQVPRVANGLETWLVVDLSSGVDSVEVALLTLEGCFSIGVCV